MNRSRVPNTYSITDLVWSFAKKIRTYDGLLIVSLFLVGAGFVLHSSHSMVCALVETKLDALSSPLARELSLGESQTSNAIFSEFKDALRHVGTHDTLALKAKDGTRPAHAGP